MKHILFHFCLIMLTIFVLGGDLISKEDFPVLKGPYIGQKPPGKTPKLFAPGLINTKDYHDYHSDYLITGRFFIFKRSKPGMGSSVLVTMLKEGRWTEPKPTSFPGKPWYHNYPFAKTGQIIYFSWRGSLGDIQASSDLNLWRVKKTGTGWSQPVKLKPPVNTTSHDTWPSVTKDRTIYFFSGRHGGFGKSDIYISKLRNGGHRDVENLGERINTEYSEVDPYITPDESCLIYCSNKPGGFGKLDFYITFRKFDGNWTKPMNMGPEINTPGNEERPYVTPDGKYLFYTTSRSGNLDIFWVDAKIIEELKPKNLK